MASSRGRLNRLRRRATIEYKRAFHRVGKAKIIAAFRRLGLEQGMTVCVHSALSQLGYVVGGPDTVIDAVMEIVGEEGCILMPSFPMASTIGHYLDQGEPFDVRHTPSRVGQITEIFRRRPGVLRSLHPTNPVAAWGKGAKAFLRDHEKSLTPYGRDTPYGRLADTSGGYILMLETHVHSMLLHLQERADFPNFYLPGTRQASYIDWDGRLGHRQTKVMRTKVPYFVAIPSLSGDKPDWAKIQDFTLMFPKRRERKVRKAGYRFRGYPRIHDRRAELIEAGALRTGRLGKSEIGLLDAKMFVDKYEAELRDLIERFRDFYDPEEIAALNLPWIES